MRFKEVRLNKRIAVAHKHGMGGCEGTLVATIDGLAYETTNKGDAFNLPYAQVETFAVDYLEKNLRVKQKRRQDLELHRQGRGQRRRAVRVPPRRRGSAKEAGGRLRRCQVDPRFLHPAPVYRDPGCPRVPYIRSS